MSLPAGVFLVLVGAAAFALVAWWRGWLNLQPADSDGGNRSAGDGGRRRPKDARRLDLVSTSIPEAIAVTNQQGRVVEANPAFRRLFRVEVEVEGRDLTELTGHKELELLVLDTLAGGGTRMLEIDQKIEIANGRPGSRHLVVSCTVLQDGSGAVLTARDITDSVLLGQIRRDLVANVSHEIKTPLTAIRGFAETLRDGALAEPETAIRFTDRILQQCDRLQALLADLLTLSRLERSEVPAERLRVQLAELLKEAAETLQPVAEERNVDLTTRLEARPELDGDPEALSELCLNLIDNAIKYNEEGGRVEALLTCRDGDIVLSVSDTGRGIPESALSRIFERFYRVDRGRSRKEGGTGLGLAIAKHAAELHGGRIEVESTLGRGSTFRVFLPAA